MADYEEWIVSGVNPSALVNSVDSPVGQTRLMAQI